ncbi:hypothetical protein AX17_007287, partial [Amanita inopinata Kibby_2008]
MGLAYFYFDVNDRAKQDVRGFLSSMVSSLFVVPKANQSVVVQLYDKHSSGLHQPTDGELIDALRGLVSGFTRAYIVIDALDECTELDQAIDLIKSMAKWSHCHLLVTSRREQVIVEALGPISHIEIDLTHMPVDEDILAYIEHVVGSQKWPMEAKIRIKEALTQKANGIWVACQLDELKRCTSMETMTETLNTLPETLEKTYDQILQKIHKSQALNAMKLLHWLVFSMCPLTLEQISIVVQINVEKDTVDCDAGLFSSSDVLNICSSLVTRTKHGTVSLAHASVKEYFLENPRKIGMGGHITLDPQNGQKFMAHCCLTYLLQLFKELMGAAKTEVSSFLCDYQLAGYCGEFWPRHVTAKNGVEAAVQVQLEKLFQSMSTTDPHWKVVFEKSLSYKYFADPEMVVSPVHYAVAHGLQHTTEWLLTAPNIYVTNKPPLLQVACAGNHKHVVQSLLMRGEDPNVQHGTSGTTLQTAVVWSDKDIVELLLDGGADPNAQ